MSFILNRRSILQAATLLPGLALLPSSLSAAGPAAGFTHSVASGDPKVDSVVLWTRFVPTDGGTTALKVEIAADRRFIHIVSRGSASSSAMTDFCVHAYPTGLEPGRWYYYRFVAPNGETSPVGRTRTLPAGKPGKFRIGVFSCANATSGWFNAYAHAAARDDLDLIVHLGDYIYESPVDRSDALAALAKARDVQPRGEAVSLADYRLRYASYRADPGLQELHRNFPMIAMWDDHETANNSWEGGAKNHGAQDGPWDVRKAAGVRAFREWLPMRNSDYDRYQIGDLATLFRLETRLLARSKQLEIGAALFGAGDPREAIARFRDGPLADPARTMMGSTQERWLADGLADSAGGGTRWQVLAQQVIVAPTRLPKVSPAWFAPGATPSGRDQAELGAAAELADAGIPMGLDRWDGYPAARTRLLAGAAKARANLVVLSGDSHNAWAYELAHEGRPVGVEFAGHSVSSLGVEKRFAGDALTIAQDFVAANPGLKWCETSRRGYMVTILTRDAVSNDWVFLPSLDIQSTAVLDTTRLVSERSSYRLSRA
ncbi:alkaline phosphatase D family protein [Sphingomonas endolithica]|uniref:alkaline phosphatase D family protein n=1 Tax=Sphingomonas endolithica TaxID=2972485 RepID=UPI0021AEE1FA|nr:alkaline phosphatase D family protein [Sphingomonas sp. ZFBP2030]